MEFTRLSQVTGDPTFYNTVLRIQERLSQIRSEYGTLVPHVLESDGRRDGQYTIGGMIDRWVCEQRYRCATEYTTLTAITNI